MDIDGRVQQLHKLTWRSAPIKWRWPAHSFNLKVDEPKPGAALSISSRDTPLQYLKLPQLWYSWRDFREARRAAQDAHLTARETLDEKERSHNLAWRTAMLNEQIGVAVTSWMAIEIATELAIRLIHDHGGSNIHPQFPTTLNARLWYLRHVPEQIDCIHDFRKRGIGLCEIIDQYKNDKETLSSGHIWIDSNNFDINITKYIVENGCIDRSSTKISYDEMANKVRNYTAILENCTKFGVDLSNRLEAPDFKSLFNKLGRAGVGHYETAQRDWVFARPQTIAPSC